MCKTMLTSMKGEINNNTIIVGDFNTPLTPMDRSTKQKINKETQTLFFFNFYFYFILLYNTLLILPYIDMNQPRVYMSSQS